MSYLDSHIHPQALAPAEMGRVHQLAVRKLFCNAANQQEWSAVVQLAELHPEVLAFIGVHPWYAESWNAATAQLLEQYLATGQLTGIGEIGLDKPCGIALSCQQDVFGQQLSLAAAFNLPVAIHCVRCWGKLLDILAVQSPRPGFMIHGFNGSTETMQRLVELGGYISFSGRLAEPGQDKLRQVFCQTPVENILLETDAPHQGSVALGVAKGQVNSLKMIVPLYALAAQLRGLEINKFCKILINNGQIYTHSKITG